MSNKKYDLCDDTCTVDCGHCKGKGRPTLFALCKETYTGEKFDEDHAADTSRIIRLNSALGLARVLLPPSEVAMIGNAMVGVHKGALSMADLALHEITQALDADEETTEAQKDQILDYVVTMMSALVAVTEQATAQWAQRPTPVADTMRELKPAASAGS